MYGLIDTFARAFAKGSEHTQEVIKVTHGTFIEPVFQFSESPIETIFLNALTLHFVAQMPMGLYIKNPLRDCPDYMRFCYELWDALSYIHSDMTQRDGVEPSTDDFMKVIEEVSFDAEDDGLLKESNLYGRLLSWKIDFVCLVMQAGFPAVTVDNRTIRTDMCIFSPKYKDLRLVVECDGYIYHSNKDSFRRDRIRDRKLKENGFDVLRFSGSEIYTNPVRSSYDLFCHINRILKQPEIRTSI